MPQLERRLPYAEARIFGFNPIRARLGVWETACPGSATVIKKTESGRAKKMLFVTGPDTVELREISPASSTRAGFTDVITFKGNAINRNCPGFRYRP